MIYKFDLANGSSMNLVDPIVVLHSVDTDGVIFDMMSNIFYAPCKLVLPGGNEIPYEFVSQTIPVTWDGPGINAWVADRLAEHAIE